MSDEADTIGLTKFAQATRDYLDRISLVHDAPPEILDVPRLLDAYEEQRSQLWRIAFRAQRGLAERDEKVALAEIEKWATGAAADGG